LSLPPLGSLLVIIAVHKGLICVIIVASLLPLKGLTLVIVIIVIATALGAVACGMVQAWVGQNS
jgi:hypothetical protein